MVVFDKDWFKLHQSKLVKVANTPFGSYIFGLIDNTKTVLEITPNGYGYIDSIDLKRKKAICKSKFFTYPRMAKCLSERLKYFWKALHFVDWLLLDRQELIPNFGFSTLTEISTGDNDGADAHIKSDAGTGTTTWSLLRDGVTISVAKTDPVLYVALQSSSSMVSGQYDHMTRTIINFDTSSGLINTLNITAADINLKLNQNYDYDDTPHYWSDTYYKLGFFNLACADPSIPATGDWDNFGSTLLTESKPIVDITSVDSYYSWSITDLSYIKVFGISEFGLMALGDGYNITPTWKNGLWWIRFYSEEYSGSSYAPRLDVTWEERVSINIGDSWKIIEDIQINVGDTWKSLSSLNINISDIWKTVF